MSKMELTAWLLPIFARVLPNLSTMIYVQEQECVMAFYKDGGLRRIPTPGEGLEFIKQVTEGLR